MMISHTMCTNCTWSFANALSVVHVYAWTMKGTVYVHHIIVSKRSTSAYQHRYVAPWVSHYHDACTCIARSPEALLVKSRVHPSSDHGFVRGPAAWDNRTHPLLWQGSLCMLWYSACIFNSNIYMVDAVGEVMRPSIKWPWLCARPGRMRQSGTSSTLTGRIVHA
jgi:hypothetical protein